jgi:amino acid permease
VSETGSFFSREELLGGLPERRASTLLFAIENRTGQLVARARRALLTTITERSAAEQERAFLAAMATGRDAGPAPSVQDLDRYAPRWQDLVPDDAPLRAALSRLILAKYAVPSGARRLRVAVGMDDPAVVAAYDRLYSERPERAFARQLSLLERMRWLRSRLADRLERMPPFWIAFALTLTETVGGGILALPIALAGFGPIGALALLVVFGLVNLLTVAALCEAITRNGHMRYGSAYFGRLVSDYLGRPGLVVLSIALTPFLAVVLLMGLIGFGDVLSGATGVHSALWTAGLFAVILLVLYRGSLDATIASAIVIGSVNLVVLAVITVVALASAGGRADPPASVNVEPQALALAFGVLLAAYFGHLSAGNAARVVLARDPGGRSLLWGSVLAMASVIVVYGIVITAIFLALDESALIGHAGTVVTPLAGAVGPVIHVLGAIYASLALGLGSLYAALGLLNLATEYVGPLRARVRDGGRVALGSRPAQFLLRAAPAIAVFLLVEFLLFSGSASFSGPLAVIGTLAVPVLIGVFPALMVAAARRRGDRLPQSVVGVVGRTPVVIALWLLYVVGVAAHVIIWEQPADRLLAVAATIATVAVTWVIVRRGALRPGASLEVRYDADRGSAPEIALVARGRPLPVAAVAAGNYGSTELRVDLPSLEVETLRLWAHRVTAADSSEGLDVRARVVRDTNTGDEMRVNLGADGEAVVFVGSGPVSVFFSGLPMPAGRGAPPRP